MSRSSLVPRELGAAGRRWVVDTLRKEFDLSQAVAPDVESGTGRVLAYLPASVTDEHAVRFQQAIFTTFKYNGGDAEASLRATVASLRNLGAETLVLETAISAESLGASALDEQLYPPTNAVVGRTVLYWRRVAELTNETMRDFTYEMNGRNVLFALSGSAGLEALLKRDWTSVRPDVSAVLVPAYDGESYVAWVREKR